MDQVGIRELRQNLSVYLRRVTGDGESLEVTERGVPVAMLGPLPLRNDPIGALEARGLISQRATADHRTLAPPLPGTQGPTLSDLVATDPQV